MASCKLNIILDIDETLIYFIHKRYIANSWEKLPKEERDKYQTIKSGENLIIIRPHLREFIDYLTKNHTVSLWTWSDEDYAHSIARNIIGGEDKLKFILSDTHAEESAELHGHSKDLNYLWYKRNENCFAECNTILIDDLPNNTIHPSNKQNSITVRPFAPFGEVKDRSGKYTPVHDDKTLLEVIELLKKIDAKGCYQDDDRRWENIFSPKNIERYGLKSYVHRIEYSPFKRLSHLPPVEAIGVGDSYHFLDLHPMGAKNVHSGRRRTRKQKARKTRKVRRSI